MEGVIPNEAQRNEESPRGIRGSPPPKKAVVIGNEAQRNEESHLE